MAIVHARKRILLGLTIAFVFVLIVGGVAYGVMRKSVVPMVELPLAQQYVPEPVAVPPQEPRVQTPSTASSSKPVAAPVVAPPVATSVAPTVPPARPAETLPREWRLAVPFLSQAPLGDWAMPYQEACEEASLLMVQAYYQGSQPDRLDPEEAKARLLALIEWQTTRRDASIVDISAQEAAQDAEAYWPELSASVAPIKTADDIRRELVAGRPVIIPAHGKSLANPHFRNGGPLYHMLVITGYLPDGRFITNDPGTRFGKDFLYTEANLLASIHDWNGGDVTNGQRVMLVLKPR